MQDFDTRYKIAIEAMIIGQQAFLKNDLPSAHAAFTRAHDLMLDCPAIHRQCHRHLKEVNWRMQNYTELAGDIFVLGFAFAGIFELIAFITRGHVLTSLLCRR